MFCARRGATYKTMTSANPRATFDPSDANSDSPICPAITEISATPIAAAVNSAEKKTNRKDFFLGKNGAIPVAHSVKKRLRTLPHLPINRLADCRRRNQPLNRHSHAPDDFSEHGVGVSAVAVAAQVSRIDRDTVAEYSDNQALDVIGDAV